MRPVTRILVTVVIGAALAAVIAYAQVIMAPPSQPMPGGVVGTPIGGSFEGLVDQDGKTVPAGAFAGKYQLVFFGFTHCPSVCPTELQRLKLVIKQLNEKEKTRLVPIFVSVDPTRDTPDVMKAYVSLFDPMIVGLTGSETAINRVKGDWKVYAARVQTPDMTEYTVDHSSFLYFRGPDGRLVDLFTTADTPDNIAASVRRAMAANP